MNKAQLQGIFAKLMTVAFLLLILTVLSLPFFIFGVIQPRWLSIPLCIAAAFWLSGIVVHIRIAGSVK